MTIGILIFLNLALLYLWMKALMEISTIRTITDVELFLPPFILATLGVISWLQVTQ